MRIFLDSSVIIAALLSPEGGSAKILECGEAGIFEIWISQQVIEETSAVIQRKLSEIQKDFEKLLTIKEFKKIGKIQQPLIQKAKKWIQDPNDVHILAAAKQGKVDYLLTLDIKHFIKDQQVAKKSGLNITTPGEFLQKILVS